MLWLSCSLDLNQIENCWIILYGDRKQFISENKLWRPILPAAKQFHYEEICKLTAINSKLLQVINKNDNSISKIILLFYFVVVPDLS